MGAGEVVAGSGELADARAAHREHRIRLVWFDRRAFRTLKLFHNATPNGCELWVVSPPGFLVAHPPPRFPAASSFDDIALESKHALAL
jgi:hypothetical protein